MASIAGLALVLLLGGVISRSTAVDAAAVEHALAIRAGERTSEWTIEIEPSDTALAEGDVRVVLHRTPRDPPNDEPEEDVVRSYRLVGTTVEERSRELAAALALVLEQHAENTTPAAVKPVTPPVPRTPAPNSAPRGWLAAGFRVALGDPADVDGGATLRGGLTWGRKIVQPIAHLASVHARSGSLRLDGVRAGVGLGVGAPWRVWWFGAAVVPQIAWMRARDRAAADAITSVTEITALGQWRGKRGLLLAARLGTDISAPPVRARGLDDSLRLGLVRFVAGVEVGLQLPLRQR